MKTILAGVVVALVSLLTVPTASALHPQETLEVSPASPLVGDSLVFTGCGFSVAKKVLISIQQPDFTYLDATESVDQSGCFAFDYTATQSGSYFILAAQSNSRQGSLEFTVG